MKKLLLLTTERKYENIVITHQGTKIRLIVGRSRSVGMSWKAVTDRPSDPFTCPNTPKKYKYEVRLGPK